MAAENLGSGDLELEGAAVMNTARYAIGMTVMMMRGQIASGRDYFYAAAVLRDWQIHRRYWSTKKNYRFCDRETMFGETRAQMIDDWLRAGFACEKQLEALVARLAPSARH